MAWALVTVLVLATHLAFVLFVVFGAVLVFRRPRLIWLHLPAAAWGVSIELTGRGCPLTALENLLRLRAGFAGYTDGFLEHYILWLLYPDGLTRTVQFVLAGIVLTINLGLYARIWRRRGGRT